MNKIQRTSLIADILNDYYKNLPVPLDHTDSFTLLIAVLLSAQCTDERVNKVTPLLFSKANSPVKMIKLTEKYNNLLKNEILFKFILYNIFFGKLLFFYVNFKFN